MRFHGVPHNQAVQGADRNRTGFTGPGTSYTYASRGVLQLPACDRCTQGVMDATNSHYLGLCSCECHAAASQGRGD